MAPKALAAAWIAAALLSCGGPPSGIRRGDASPPAGYSLAIVPEETLRSLRHEIDRKQWELAVDVLDEIAGFGRGALARPDPAREHWVNVWDGIHSSLRRAPTPLVGAYRARHDGPAAEAFEAAWRLRDWARCSDLADRHFLATGFTERAGRLVAAALEAGDVSAAARLGGRLVDTLDPDKWWPTLVAQTAVALAQMGRRDALRALHERVDGADRLDEWIRLGEDRMLLSELFVRLERDPPAIDRLAPAPPPRDLRFPEGADDSTWEAAGLTLRRGGSYVLQRPDPAPGWSVELGRISGEVSPVGWLRDGSIHLMLAGRLVFAVEGMTGRLAWVRSVDDLLR
jgi:hypothetical protein